MTTTTEAKAKALRPYVERLITKAKRDGQHACCTVTKETLNKSIVVIPFEELVPVMDSEHVGGYTRLVCVDNRKGDNASPMCIEFAMKKVEKKVVVKATEKTTAKVVADEAGKAAKAAAERAEETREEGDLAKANEVGEVVAKAGKAADAAEQVTNEK